MDNGKTLPVRTINDLAKLHGHAANSGGQGRGHDYFNFTVRELHAFVSAVLTASAIDAEYKPEYKTITDHNGRVTGVQWVNAADAPVVGATQATPEGGQDLPPLPAHFGRFNIDGPDGHRIKGYTADQMRDYARAALAASQQATEPVIYVREMDIDGTFSDKGVYGSKIADEHWNVPLYRAAPPQPQTPPRLTDEDVLNTLKDWQEQLLRRRQQLADHDTSGPPG